MCPSALRRVNSSPSAADFVGRDVARLAQAVEQIADLPRQQPTVAQTSEQLDLVLFGRGVQARPRGRALGEDLTELAQLDQSCWDRR